MLFNLLQHFDCTKTHLPLYMQIHLKERTKRNSLTNPRKGASGNGSPSCREASARRRHGTPLPTLAARSSVLAPIDASRAGFRLCTEVTELLQKPVHEWP
jgi:hypothetical protein